MKLRLSWSCLGAFVAMLLTFEVAISTPASAATLEQVGTFAGSGEAVQLGGVTGMAVNIDGAGGVPAGTFYAATKGPAGGTVRVARFNPDGSLSEVWQVTEVEEPYERCGPDGELVEGNPVPCPTRPAAEPKSADVDVDQTTGNVYVYNTTIIPGRQAIVEYSPDGSEVLARFGEIAVGGEKTVDSPAKIHDSPLAGSIAVNAAGEVYVFDLNNPDNFYHRLMVFKPKTPGKFDEYEYAGEIAGGFLNEGEYPSKPVSDATGNIYVAGESYIEEYAPEAPGAYPHHSTPICSFEYKKGGITAITVNPETGEPFFFSYKSPKRIHQLGPCEGGTFKEIGTIEVKPQRDDLWGLAYDPKRKFSEGRPPGVLYGGAPGPVPSSGVGEGEPGTTSLGYTFAPAEEAPPLVESESVSKVTASEARLEAVINPRSFDTTYAFQYLSEAAWEGAGETFAGAEEAPIGGEVLGEGSEPIAAAVMLGGLAPDATYHYRVVATSNCSPSEPAKVCEVLGPDQFFNTYPVGAVDLPDGRAWELVSPAQKNGGQVLPAEPSTTSCNPVECKPGDAYQHFPMQSSPDGDAVVYEGSPFFPGQGAVIENEYLSRRGASGWGTANLTPAPLVSKGGQGYKAFTADLASGVLEQTIPSLSANAPPEYANLYGQPTSNPALLTPLLGEGPPPNHLPFNRVAGGGSNSLKLSYAGASADLSRIFFEANDALTEASAFAPEAIDGGGAKKNLYEWAGGQLRLVNVAPGNAVTAPGAVFGAPDSRTLAAISADGSRAFWTSETGQLYVRIDGEQTLEVKHAAKFLSASADGSKVLLADGCLYDVAAEACEDLTAGQGGFLGLAGQSEDLSHVYFTDTAVLSGEEENSEGAKAVVGKPNLYAWAEGTISFVATLGSGDSVAWAATPALRMAEASPNGEWLAFLSKTSLTGYDNVGPCELTGGGAILDVPCAEAFLYDSASGGLACASCSPANARPLGRTVLRLIKSAPGLASASISTLPQPRYLTDSGRLYFDSQDSLSPADTNGNVEDVYQFEPQGIGACKREGGCVSLISAGRSAIDSNFLAMDESGGNVFFTTRDQLLAADTDTLIDLYDARVGGGFSSESQLPPKGCGEGCQLQPPAPAEAPPSAGFSGPGNVKPRCPKGKVKKKVRCVRKAKRSAKAKRAKHKRGGAR